MDLCFVNVEQLKKFVLNPVEQEHQVITFTVGGYEYQFNFVIDEIKVETKPRKLRVRWDVD